MFNGEGYVLCILVAFIIVVLGIAALVPREERWIFIGRALWMGFTAVVSLCGCGGIAVLFKWLFGDK
jgi:hypothetical protein